MNQTVKNIPLSVVTRQLAYESQESAQADLQTHGLEIVMSKGVPHVKFAKQALLESTAGEMTLPRRLVSSKMPFHRWSIMGLPGSTSSSLVTSTTTTKTLLATHDSIPSPVKAPSSPAVVAVAAKKMKTATPPAQRTYYLSDLTFECYVSLAHTKRDLLDILEHQHSNFTNRYAQRKKNCHCNST